MTLEYDYDGMGRVTSVTYPDGRVVTQGYDTTGRLTAMPGYLSGSIAYDSVGRPASWTMANGVEANQGYDGVGRIASLGYSGDDDIASFSFRYDGAGNMVGKNRSSYSYDSRNRLSLADEIGRYAADAREMGKAATYASLDATGERAMSHVSLDAEIRLDQGAASVGIDLGASYEVATITATPLSLTHRVTERNLVVLVSTYGSDYSEVDDWSFATLPDGSFYIRLAEPVKARYVKLHCRYDERDADGSVHDVSTFRNAARSIVTVGYHETSRRESYDYDDQCNRLYVENRLGSRTDSSAYSYYAGSDRVRTSGDRAYVYDQNGNMTTRGTSYAFDGDDPIYEHDGYYRSYKYDLQNRLVKVSGYVDGVLTVLATYTYAGDNLRLTKTAGGVVKVSGYVDGVLSVLATYTYAGDNLRLTKTAGGVTTRYVHGVDGNELYRSTASDSVSTVWFFGRKLVEIEQAGGTETRTYLHTDHLGSVVAATDETGATIWRGDNSAFGVATADVGLESRTASYTGKDYDEEAGLFYFNARWYDAELGRFTTEDPARDDVNWYVYVNNRAMTLIDPEGREPQDSFLLFVTGAVTVTKPDYPNVYINRNTDRTIAVQVSMDQSYGMAVTMDPGASVSINGKGYEFGITVYLRCGID